MDVPTIVTSKGRLFMSLGRMKIGVEKMNFEKNHPETIVPRASRRRAFLRLVFSSFVGESGSIVGLERKQNEIIRNL